MQGFKRKPPAVGTAMDREELEQLLDRFEKTLPEIKNAIFEMTQATKKAERIMEALNKALDKSEREGRRRLTGRTW